MFAVVAAPFFGESVTTELQPLSVCVTDHVCTAHSCISPAHAQQCPAKQFSHLRDMDASTNHVSLPGRTEPSLVFKTEGLVWLVWLRDGANHHIC